MPAQEVTFDHLAGVPVHYDRLAHPFGYGSKGQLRTFGCRQRLKTALTEAFLIECRKRAFSSGNGAAVA